MKDEIRYGSNGHLCLISQTEGLDFSMWQWGVTEGFLGGK